MFLITPGRRRGQTGGRWRLVDSASVSARWLSSLRTVSTEPDRPAPLREYCESGRTGSETKPPQTNPDPSAPTPTQNPDEMPTWTAPDLKEPSAEQSLEVGGRLEKYREGNSASFKSTCSIYP